jgi:crossover junction endodeoxyribonuclease RusA
VSEPGGSVITPVVNVWVPGVPKPQGSKRAYVIPGTGRAKITEDNPKLHDWRADAKLFARYAMLAGPHDNGTDLPDMVVPPLGVTIRILFIMPRPLSTPKTRPTPLATKKPDADKLVRGVLDALTGIVYADDSQVIGMNVGKRIAELGEQPGALIDVSKVEIAWTPK